MPLRQRDRGASVNGSIIKRPRVRIPKGITGRRPYLANAPISTVDCNISAHDFFKERRYVILKYCRHVTNQKYPIYRRNACIGGIRLGEIRSATSMAVRVQQKVSCFSSLE